MYFFLGQWFHHVNSTFSWWLFVSDFHHVNFTYSSNFSDTTFVWLEFPLLQGLSQFCILIIDPFKDNNESMMLYPFFTSKLSSWTSYTSILIFGQLELFCQHLCPTCPFSCNIIHNGIGTTFITKTLSILTLGIVIFNKRTLDIKTLHEMLNCGFQQNFLLLCWVSLCWVSLCWVPLCRLSLCWVLLCWVPLCRVSLCWGSYWTVLPKSG
jgi:hypothetical protein